MAIIDKIVERYPDLPTFLANTVASKVIQLIKNKTVDPAFSRERVVQEIQSWPQSVQKTAEWVLHTLSGAVRTLPDQEHPVGIILQEALAETLTQVSIKVNEISAAERTEIIDMAMPIVRDRLIGSVRSDYWFRDRLDAIFGTSQDWDVILDEAVNSVSRFDEKTQTHRAARKARGWGRFLWSRS